jgi:hypothetical protein
MAVVPRIAGIIPKDWHFWGMRGPSLISRFPGRCLLSFVTAHGRHGATYTDCIKMNGMDREEVLIYEESVPRGLDNTQYRSPREGRPKNGHLRSLGGPGRKPRACKCSNVCCSF